MKRFALAVLAVLLVNSAWARDGERAPRPSNQIITRAANNLPRLALATPRLLSATTSSNRVALSWADVPNETGFIIERRRSGTKRFAEIAKTTVDRTTYTDILTDTAVRNEYRVRAYSATGRVTYSGYTNIAYSTVAAPCP
ncbi:MAG TPA: fibronectin type III domain-containing protein [Alphaproteobacteria bacterium]|nr:fibronectin type III domain-containing protein [Alphaproteobacteria bacterium]